MDTNPITPENEFSEESTDFVYGLAAADGLVPGQHGMAFAARGSGLYRTDDGGQTWQDALTSLNLNEPVPTLCLAISPAFAEDGTLVAGSSGGVFRSTDRGTTWKGVLLPPPPPAVSALAVSPNFAQDGTLFAGTMEDGVFISTDGGESWVAWNFGLLDLNVMCLSISPNFATDETIFAGTDTGIFRSTNGGRAWRDIELPFGFETVLSLAVSPNFASDHTLLAGTESQGLWVSRDEGDTWEALGHFEDPINGILLYGQETLVITGSGLWQMQDGAWKNRLPPQYAGREVSTASAPTGFDTPLLIGFVDGTVEPVRLA